MSTELASAYVQIIPSAKGISGSISSILEPEADKAGKSAGGKLGSALGTAAKVGAGAITAATAALAAGGAAFVKSSNEVAQYGDNVDKMSQKLGLSAKSYQEWDYVMQLAGTDMGSMTTGLKTLTNKLDDAKNGSDEARGMFEKLGISMEDINTMSREDLFAKTIEGFQGMADSTDRAALANDLFGKSGQNLAPLFNQSAEATKGLIEQANQYGMIMSGDAVKASADFEDALTRMQSTMTGAKNALIAEFLPSLTSMMDGVSMLVSGDKNGFDKISEGVDELVKNITDAAPKLLDAGVEIVESFAKAIIDNLPKLIETGLPIIMKLADAIIENLPALLDAAVQIILQIATGIAEALPELIPTIVDTILFIVDSLIDNVDLLVDASIALILGLAEGLINALPKLIEKAPEIVIKLTEAIIRNVPKIVEASAKLIAMLVTGLVKSYSSLIKAGADALQKIKEGFSVEKALTWGKDLIDNFIRGIKAKWSDLKNAVKDLAETVKSYIGFSEPEVGPLSNFHTYAPDMMELFAKGIKDNEDLIADQMNESLSIPVNMGINTASGGSGSTSIAPTINVYGAAGQDVNELADAIMDRMNDLMYRKEAAYA
jgi:hypothetical protein